MKDVMIKEQKMLNENQRFLIEKIKTLGNEFFEQIVMLEFEIGRKRFDEHREFRESKVRIEEAVMWAVKGIATQDTFDI